MSRDPARRCARDLVRDEDLRLMLGTRSLVPGSVALLLVLAAPAR